MNLNAVFKSFRLDRTVPPVILPLLGVLIIEPALNYNLIFVAVCIIISTVAGSLVNDYFDIEIDKVNKPYLPIPSGQVTKGQVKALIAGLYLISLCMSFALSWKAGVALIAIIFIAFFYSGCVKLKGLLGEATVSLAGAILVPYGVFLSQKNINNVIILVTVSTFIFFVAATVWMTIFDVDGDSKAGSKTTAVVFGVERAKLNALMIWVAGGLLTMLFLALSKLPLLRMAIYCAVQLACCFTIYAAVKSKRYERAVANLMGLFVIVQPMIFILGGR
ncbi:MAG TPA: UbiA family prenyltransferase [Clostridia bacterium]